MSPILSSAEAFSARRESSELPGLAVTGLSAVSSSTDRSRRDNWSVSSLIMLPEPVQDQDDLRAHDAVRLTRDLNGMPSGSEGVVVGWYANQPEFVIVRLNEGGVHTVPRHAVRLIEAAPETPTYV